MFPVQDYYFCILTSAFLLLSYPCPCPLWLNVSILPINYA